LDDREETYRVKEKAFQANGKPRNNKTETHVPKDIFSNITKKLKNFITDDINDDTSRY